MKLKRIKNPLLSGCKNFILDTEYLVGFTGRRVLLLDYDFQLVASCDKLSYAYTGELSPDKQKLLTVSAENRFYIHAYPSLEPIDRVTVRAPYNDGLEELGCWSFDGKKVFVCAMNSKTLNSTLRIYNADNLTEYTDLLKEKYWLQRIQAVKPKNKYLLIGLNRTDNQTYLIWYDGNRFEEFPLAGFDDAVMRANYNESNDQVEIYTGDALYLYDCHGNFAKEKDLRTGQTGRLSFSSVLDDAFDDDKVAEEMKNLSAALGLEELPYDDCVQDVVFSKNRSIAYVATNCRVIAYDMAAEKIIDQKTNEYEVGARKIVELSENKILVTSWDGILLYELS